MDLAKAKPPASAETARNTRKHNTEEDLWHETSPGRQPGCTWHLHNDNVFLCPNERTPNRRGISVNVQTAQRVLSHVASGPNPIKASPEQALPGSSCSILGVSLMSGANEVPLAGDRAQRALCLELPCISSSEDQRGPKGAALTWACAVKTLQPESLL